MSSIYDNEIIRLYRYDNAVETALPWIIWRSDTIVDLVKKIPDYKDTIVWRTGQLVLRNGQIYECIIDTVDLVWDAGHWLLVEPGVGFVTPYRDSRGYVLDEFVLDDTNTLLVTNRITTPGPLNPIEWDAVATLSHVETASIYIESLDRFDRTEVISGTMVLLGGEPDVTENPNQGDTFLDEYFRAGEPGAWYRPSILETVFQDSAGKVPVTAPGQRVGYMLDVSGNGHHAFQNSDAYRPIYRIDANGRGYLEMTGNQHMEIFLAKADITEYNAEVSVGAYGYTNQIAPGLYELGGRERGFSKSRHTGMTALLFRALTESEQTQAHAQFKTESLLYSPGTVTTLKGFFAGDVDFNYDINDWVTNAVTDMSELFRGAVEFDQPLDAWDVSNVITMAYMFQGATVFNQFIDSWVTTSLQNLTGFMQDTDAFNQSLNNWDVSNVTKMDTTFQNAKAFNGDITLWNTINVTTMQAMFRLAVMFNRPITNWTTTNVTDMSSMFYGAESFNQNLTGWNVGSVATMASMFRAAPAFNGLLDTWRPGACIDMSHMFADATDYHRPMGDWTVQNVKDFSHMFANARVFNRDISQWNVTNAQTMAHMFQQASTFNQPLGDWLVGNVIDFTFMFDGAGNFNQDLRDWCVQPDSEPDGFATSGCPLIDANKPKWGSPCLGRGAGVWYDPTDISTLFQDSAGTVPVTGPGQPVGMMVDITGNGNNARQSDALVAPIYRTDADGVGYVEFPQGHFMTVAITAPDITIVESLPGIGGWRWGGHSAAGTYTLGNWNSTMTRYLGQCILVLRPVEPDETVDFDNIANSYARRFRNGTITDLTGYFAQALGFNHNLSLWNVTEVTRMDSMFQGTDVFNAPIGGWKTFKLLSISRMFQDAVAFNQSLNGWDTSNVTDMSYVFAGTLAFNSNVNNWQTRSVTNMAHIFDGAAVFNQTLAAWNVSKVKDLSYAFANTAVFNQSLLSWVPAACISIQGMFKNAVAFNQPLGSWAVQNIQDYSYLFDGAVLFNQYLGGWRTTNAVNMAYIFANCPEFNQPIETWDMRKVTDLSGAFLKATGFNQSLNNWNTSAVLDMTSMFEGASAFDRPLGLWDVSNVTQFDNMFKDAIAFNRDITDWCVENIPGEPVGFKTNCPLESLNAPRWGFDCVGVLLDVWYAFSDKGTLFQKGDKTLPVTTDGQRVGYVVDLTGNGFDAKQLNDALRPVYREDASGKGYVVFSGDQHLLADINQPIVTHYECIPSVGAFKYNGLQSINQYRVGPRAPQAEKTHYCGMMAMAFGNPSLDADTRLTELVSENSLTFAPGTVTDLSWYFANDDEFNHNIGDWDVSRVTTISHMFDGCDIFNQSINTWDTVSLTDMSYAFANTAVMDGAMRDLDLSSLTDLHHCFFNAKAFNQSIDLWDVSRVTDFSHVFDGAIAFNRPVETWDMRNARTLNYMFANTNLFNQPLNGWVLDNVNAIRGIFKNAIRFDQTIGNWDVSRVTDFSEVFWDAKAFNRSLNAWDVSQGIRFVRMFSGAAKFNSNIAGWALTDAEDMSYMFSNAILFNYDINAWDTRSFINVTAMFQNARAFNQPLDNWVTKSITGMEYMFNNALVFNQDITSWCVTQLPAEPVDFATNSPLIIANKPKWGQLCLGDGTGIIYQPQRIDTLFQDSAGTIPVTAAGQPVGLMRDVSGSGIDAVQADNALRPTYQVDTNGKGYLVFQNDQFMLVASPNPVKTEDHAIPSIGRLSFVFDAPTGNHQIGPHANDPNKTWYIGEMLLLTDSIPPDQHLLLKDNIAAEASSFANGTVTSLAYYFYQETEQVDDINNWTTRYVTNMSDMFRASDCNAAIGNWDTRNVTDMSRMFKSNVTFNQPLNGWVTGSVIDMRNMFENADAFNQPLNNWNTSSVRYMDTMFAFTENFNGLIGDWNTASLISMTAMFASAKAFNRPVNNWNITGVNSLFRVFKDAIAFDQPLDDWDTVNVVNMQGTFNGASSFNQDLSTWSTGKVISFESLFDGASKFNQDISMWDVGLVNNYSSCFKDAVVFNQPLNTWDTAKAVNFSTMFQGAKAFNQSLDNWVTDLVESMEYMFNDADLFNQDISNWCVSQFPVEPVGFATNGCPLTEPNKPKWGGVCLGALVTSWYDAEIMSSLWQDTAGTIPVTAIGQSVRRIDDLSGRGHHLIITEPTTDDFATLLNNGGRNVVTMRGKAQFFRPTVTGNTNIFGVLPEVGYWYYTDVLNGSVGVVGNSPTAVLPPIGGDHMFVSFVMVKDGTVNVTDLAVIESVAQTVADSRPFTGPNPTLSRYFWSNTDVPVLSAWDTRKITDMSYMFTESNFNQSIADWDVTNVITMANMFELATVFDQPLTGWVTTNLTDATRMFYGASNFNQNITHFSMGKVRLTVEMFQGATAFNNGSLTDDTANPLTWNTGFVNSMVGMFRQASSFNQDITLWDTSAVNNMSGMFYGASVFNQPLNGWDVSKVTNFSSTFRAVNAFNQPLNNWDVSSATNFGLMFYEAKIFDQPLDTWNTAKATTMAGMFGRAPKFNQPLNSWDTANVKNMSYMFENADLFNQPIGNWDTSSVTNMDNMFSKALVFNQDISTWNTSNVTTMGSMFSNADSFNMPLDTWDTGKVTNMSYMFNSADVFNQPLGTWNVTATTNLINMFNSARQFDQDLTTWCVKHIPTTPDGFSADGCPIAPANLPLWGSACTLGLPLDAFWDANQITSLWRDAAGTVSVTGPNQNVMRINDLTGNGYDLYTTDPAEAWLYREDSNGRGFLSRGANAAHFRVNLIRSDFTFVENVPGIGAWGLMGLDSTGEFDHNLSVSATSNGRRFAQGGLIFDQANVDIDVINTVLAKEAMKYVNNDSSLGRYFSDMSTFNWDIAHWDLGTIDNLGYMFYNAKAFNQNINAWDVSTIVNLDSIFRGAESFNQPLDNWDVTNTKFLRGMFAGAKAFNQPVSTFNTSNCIDFSDMFSGASVFNQTVNSFDTRKATTVSGMFARASKFNNGSLTDDGLSPLTLDTRLARSISYMFNTATSFNQTVTLDTSAVTDATGAFWIALAFNNGDVGDLKSKPLTLDMSSCKNMSSMFNTARKFNQYIGDWDVSACTDFYNCFKATNIFNNGDTAGASTRPLLWTTSSATRLAAMFDGATVFNQPIPNFDTSNVVGTTDPVTYTNGSFFISRGFSAMFRQAASFNQPVNHFVIHPDNQYMYAVFLEASNFNQPLNNWDVSNVVTMAYLFSSATAFNQDISMWNVANCVDFSGMFFSTTVFNQDLSAWNVTGTKKPVKGPATLYFAYMFSNNAVINTDLSGWCVEHVSTIPDGFVSPTNTTLIPPVWGAPCS